MGSAEILYVYFPRDYALIQTFAPNKYVKETYIFLYVWEKTVVGAHFQIRSYTKLNG